jgi:hypothetical protein
MNELLDDVIAAHGGLAQWKAFAKVEATIVTDGALWGMKGLFQDPDPREMTVSLHQEWASVTPFGASNQRTAFTPDRIAIETTDGSLVAERRNPRQSFEGHEKTTPWDPLHRAYFNGYALWTYLTTPFLFKMPGVETQLVEPWSEGDEIWQRLRVRFPPNLATHSDVQDFFFDRHFMLRRHDYSVDVAGGFAAAQLVYDYAEVQGLRLPTKRRAYQRGTDDRPIKEPLMVSIDLSNIRFS